LYRGVCATSDETKAIAYILFNQTQTIKEVKIMSIRRMHHGRNIQSVDVSDPLYTTRVLIIESLRCSRMKPVRTTGAVWLP
jgi:hypothetical protein